MADLLVTVEEGQLSGQQDVDIDGRPFLSFLGVPYAKPPVGPLRFKDPEPVESWTGIRDATKEGSPCFSMQFLPFETGFKLTPGGSEDCLFLNIFTRQLYDEEAELKPVMVFIHGGGFTSGANSRILTGPEFLLTEDIVLIAINYRLGALGFLSLADPALEVSGNAGLKDMVQALKWIRRNVKQFGGDAENVTIFGVSAGGAAVHYLLLSPLAKGLFHRAIAQSGCAVNPWAQGENDARRLAEALGYTGSHDDDKILEFLRETPVDKIIEAQTQFPDFLGATIQRPFSPGVEGDSPTAFLSKDPFELVNLGEYTQVPLMIGYTVTEGMLVEMCEKMTLPITKDNFVPYYFKNSEKDVDFDEINKKIIKHYFKTEEIDENNKEALYAILTDLYFLRGIHLVADSYSKTATAPVYYYRMTLDAGLSLFKRMCNISAKGVCHGDDMGYLFKMGFDTQLEPGSFAERSVKRFVKLWVNFARTGNPTPVEDEELDHVKWLPVEDGRLNCLDLGEELKMDVNPDGERMMFWDEISKPIGEYY